MSIWTHINASIRVDTFESIPEFKLQSTIYRFNQNIPNGSEGPLTVSYAHSYLASNQSFTTFSISGDLRDYDSEDVENELLPWFNSIVKDISIRQAILEVYIEFDKTIILQYNNKTGVFNIISTVKGI